MLSWFATVSWERKRDTESVAEHPLRKSVCKGYLRPGEHSFAVIWFPIAPVCLMCSARTPKQCHAAGLSPQPWKAAWRVREVIGYLANDPQRFISFLNRSRLSLTGAWHLCFQHFGQCTGLWESGEWGWGFPWSHTHWLFQQFCFQCSFTAGF